VSEIAVPTHALVDDLTRLLGSRQVLADHAALTAYAIDAGIYRILPRAVVLIESERDVERVLAYSRERRLPLTARSGGTNLTGSAIGEGLIVDFSRLRRVHEVNPAERWARVEPGMVYAELNRALAPHGLRFAPDPSSGEMCKLGDARQQLGGAALAQVRGGQDNVLSLDVRLWTGRACSRRRTDRLARVRELFLRVPSVRGLYELIHDHRAAILARRLSVSKNSSGYNLFALAEGLERGVLDLPRLFVGSEGTLGLITEATIRLVPLPESTATALFFFARLAEVTRAVAALRPLAPSAMELIDGHTLDLIGRARSPSRGTAAVSSSNSTNRPPPSGWRANAACHDLAQTAPAALAADPERQASSGGPQAIYPRCTATTRSATRSTSSTTWSSRDRLAELIAYRKTCSTPGA
jgi:FAD/FMN-containing dehydrogenase